MFRDIDQSYYKNTNRYSTRQKKYVDIEKLKSIFNPQ